jgi:hypothetical protein
MTIDKPEHPPAIEPQAEPSKSPDPAGLTPQERHIIWLDRQETYLAWAGIFGAFTITLAFLIVSAWVISIGHEVGGTILGTVDLVALSTVFITRRAIQLGSKTPTTTSPPKARRTSRPRSDVPRPPDGQPEGALKQPPSDSPSTHSW